MSWPLASHFSAMLQSPKVAFRDPQLQSCRIEKDARNQPRPWSGAFAVVYKGMDANGRNPFAIRVFTTESPERRERYDFISAYLKTRKLGCLVDFEYRDRSIRASDGKWYPLILMDWVQGETLFQWVRGRCLADDRAALAGAARVWQATVKELGDAQIAHGDLQHANVMVTEAGQIKLVDYDGMCVPALVGRRNLEVGIEPYQHPDRCESTLLGLGLDNFSALVIYVALRALAASPDLWARHVEKPGHDKLLFRREDLLLPAGSELCAELKTSPDPEAWELTQRLLEQVRAQMDQVPSLAQLTNSYAKIEQLLRQQEWSAAVKLLNRRGRFRDAPEELKPLIRQAYEYVCRKQAWAAFQAVPRDTSDQRDRELVHAWNEPLFAGFEPAERERERVVAARQRLEIFDRLYHLAQESSAAVSLDVESRILELAGQLPLGFRHSLEQRVALARQRVDAVDHIVQALGEPVIEAAIAAAWQGVVEAQCPTLVDPSLRARAELAEKRVPLIAALQELPARLPPDQLDRRILAIWREELLDSCAQAAAWRPAYELALRRKELLRRLQTAVDTRDGPAIVALVDDPCLAEYPLSAGWTAVVNAARQRAARTGALVDLLRDRDRGRFLEMFDTRLVQQYADRFAPYRDLLCQWTAAEILPAENMGLGPAVGRGSLVRVAEPPGAYRVRWTWPQTRFSDECLLTISAEEPGPGEDPTSLPTLHRLMCDRQNWESGGGSRLLHPEPDWAGCYVAVWARVDLGFQQFFSHPLILGRLPQRFGWKPWRWLASWSRKNSHAGGKTRGRVPPPAREADADG